MINRLRMRVRTSRAGENGDAGMVRMAAAMPILALLREFGLDPAAVLAELKFPMQLFADPENRVPLARLGRLALDCAELTQCPHFGLLVGERCGAATLGKVGFLAKYAPDVGTALSTLAANLPHNNTAVDVSLLVRAQRTTVGLSFRNPDFPGVDQVADACLALLVMLMRELCGKEWRTIEVLLRHRRTDDLRPYRRCFGASVRFDAAENAVVFDSRWLTHRIGHADPELSALMARDLRESAKPDAAATTVGDHVARIVRAAIGRRTPMVRDIAGALGMHPRTLGRRLAAEGTNFRDIVARTHHEAACQLLRDTEIPIGGIARMLDFDEAGAFTRAFRRWTGHSPLEWRKRNAKMRHPAAVQEKTA